ncbi:hypothetical protein B9Z55_023524 [Caenorhabditis nigoni]|uniref:Uncharacterized protein n=1 Tax=Caenorhabditis nigoni TaxID=1611254 RepID=A0A2G5SQS7_9PELO|nr:hypothetical protein B9Z55_023524 [Caenorhabditis nigoni]
MDSADDDGVGGESEEEEETGVMDPQYWQRKFDDFRGHFFAPLPPSQVQAPVPQMPFLPPSPFTNVPSHLFAHQLHHYSGMNQYASPLPQNCPQFGAFVFPGFGPQFGHTPSQAPSTSAMKTPDARVRPTPKEISVFGAKPRKLTRALSAKIFRSQFV